MDVLNYYNIRTGGNFMNFFPSAGLFLPVSGEICFGGSQIELYWQNFVALVGNKKAACRFSKAAFCY